MKSFNQYKINQQIVSTDKFVPSTFHASPKEAESIRETHRTLKGDIDAVLEHSEYYEDGKGHREGKAND